MKGVEHHQPTMYMPSGQGDRSRIRRKRFNIYHYRLQQCDSVNYHIYRLSSPLFPGVQMLVRIYEVQLHYKIIYFDIYITTLYIFLYMHRNAGPPHW